jgi:hypothetical protein
MKKIIKPTSIFVMLAAALWPVNVPVEGADLPFAPIAAVQIVAPIARPPIGPVAKLAQFGLGHDCDGGKGSACTEHKWQSDYYGQTPYQSLVQPNPSVCLSDDRCLYSTGDAANHGTVNGVWICSWATLGGYQQGVWYQCEETRANAHKVIEGYECQSVGVNYVWIPVR